MGRNAAPYSKLASGLDDTYTQGVLYEACAIGQLVLSAWWKGKGKGKGKGKEKEKEKERKGKGKGNWTDTTQKDKRQKAKYHNDQQIAMITNRNNAKITIIGNEAQS